MFTTKNGLPVCTLKPHRLSHSQNFSAAQISQFAPCPAFAKKNASTFTILNITS
jgi:hypothetical protein